MTAGWRSPSRARSEAEPEGGRERYKCSEEQRDAGASAYVAAAQRGDPAAMNQLMAELAPWVRRICGSIALDRGPDAMQETFIIVLRNLVTLREPAALRAWVRRIAVRESLRVLRAERDLAVADVAALAESVGLAPAAGADNVTAIDVRDTLAALSPVQRAVLVLRHVEDLTEKETADVLHVEPGTVKSRSHRAALAFRRRWQP